MFGILNVVVIFNFIFGNVMLLEKILESIWIVIEDVNDGDLLEINCGLYNYWVVYIGKNWYINYGIKFFFYFSVFIVYNL